MIREYRLHVECRSLNINKCMSTFAHGKYSAGDRLAQEIADALDIPEDQSVTFRMWLPDAPRKRWTSHVNANAY